MSEDLKAKIARLLERRAAIDRVIARLRALDEAETSKTAPTKKPAAKKAAPKGGLSPAARKAIAAVQRKRWAAFRKAAKTKAAKP
jgi:hypothetical protein